MPKGSVAKQFKQLMRAQQRPCFVYGAQTDDIQGTGTPTMQEIHLSGVAQGTTINTRVGDAVDSDLLEVNFEAYTTTVPAGIGAVRFIILKATQAGGSLPTITEVFPTSAPTPITPFNPEFIGSGSAIKYVVLHDRTVDFGSVDNAPDATYCSGYLVRTHKVVLKLKDRTTWGNSNDTGSTVAGAQSNHYFSLVITDIATDTTNVSTEWIYKFRNS